MTLNLKKMKDYLLTKEDFDIVEDKPEIGFKIAHCPQDKQLIVKIISARNLPSCYSNNKAKGFLTKVNLTFDYYP